MKKNILPLIAVFYFSCDDNNHAPTTVEIEGRVPVSALASSLSVQPMSVSSVVTDPFWQLEREGSEAYGLGLSDLTRTAAPISVTGVTYAHARGGKYVDCSTAGPEDDCGPALWESITHQVRAYPNAGGTPLWTHSSAWKPLPGIYGLVSGYEPLFQFGISGNNLYVPSSNGRVAIVSRATGAVVTTSASPAGGSGYADTYVTSPVVVDGNGNAWYTVTQMASLRVARDAWLVKMSPSGAITSRKFSALAPSDASCTWSYDFTQFLPVPFITPLPWPPSNTVGPTFGCGVPRPQVNAAPAISGDTVIVVSRWSLSYYAELVRVRASDMATVQRISLRGVLADDCGVATPSTAVPGEQTDEACLLGTPVGLDRTTGLLPGGRAIDSSTSSPVALPDGGIAIGVYSLYRNEQGHLMIFNPDGSFRWARSFGWLVNPGVRLRPGSLQYDLIAQYSAYDVGPFWIQSYDGQSGSRRWSYSSPAGSVRAAQQCLSLPGGDTTCETVTGRGEADFVARRPVTDVSGNVWIISSNGDVQKLNGATGALVSSTPIAALSGGMLDAPLTVDGSTVRVAVAGRLFVLRPTSTTQRCGGCPDDDKWCCLPPP